MALFPTGGCTSRCAAPAAALAATACGVRSGFTVREGAASARSPVLPAHGRGVRTTRLDFLLEPHGVPRGSQGGHPALMRAPFFIYKRNLGNYLILAEWYLISTFLLFCACPQSGRTSGCTTGGGGSRFAEGACAGRPRAEGAATCSGTVSTWHSDSWAGPLGGSDAVAAKGHLIFLRGMLLETELFLTRHPSRSVWREWCLRPGHSSVLGGGACWGGMQRQDGVV
uniref:Putative secreted protein n=1 Tax=Ixodes ricinus TaxID=34613 RepID=A0A6B0V4F4_IXORI